jgi:beta-1,4-glucosyltransferase
MLMSPTVDVAPERLVGALVEKQRELAAVGLPVRVTWLNHYSIRVAMAVASAELSEMHVCGVDGQLLKWLLRHPVRTSADVVVPLLLKCDETIRTVLAIGGHGDRRESLENALSDAAGRFVQVYSMNGFDELLRGEELARLVAEIQPDLILVGLGAGLQDKVLLEAAAALDRGYALTCGGFLDQVLQTNYYPSWAYPLRLNWLVRLAREPRRLWRRYTVEALSAVLRRRTWRRAATAVPGVLVHQQMCLPERYSRKT